MLNKVTGVARWDALIDLIERHFDSTDNLIGAEIGVHKGETTDKLLEHFPTMFLHCVDSWTIVDERDWEPFYADWLQVKSRYCERIEEHKIDSNKAVVEDKLDFVFIDANHTVDGCYNDIVYWLPKVKSNGIVCGHDLAATIVLTGHPFSVQMAVMKYFGNKYHTAYGNIWYHIKQ